MQRYILLVLFAICSLPSMKRPPKQELATIVDTTFGVLCYQNSELFRSLKADLVASRCIDAHMQYVAKYFEIYFEKQKSNDIETKYYRTAANYMQQLLDAQLKDKTVAELPKHNQEELQRTLCKALTGGFDEIVLDLANRGIADPKDLLIQNAMKCTIENCALPQQKLLLEYYSQRRTRYILALKHWLAKSRFDRNTQKAPDQLPLRKLNNLLEIAQKYDEPETCSLLVFHGASSVFIKVPDNYLAKIALHQTICESAATKEKNKNNPAWVDSRENRTYRRWDVRACHKFFSAFTELKKDKDSYVSWLPQDLLKEIEYFRFGISDNDPRYAEWKKSLNTPRSADKES